MSTYIRLSRPLALLLAAALFFTGCLAGAQPSPKVGQAAPDLTLARLDGGQVRLSELRGKVVLLNFWSTTCPPCRAEMPDLDSVYAEVKDKGGVVLAIDQREAPDTVSRFVAELRLTFPVGIDSDGSLFSLYGVQFLPTSFVVDKNGIIRYMKVGQMEKEAIRAYFSTLQ